jgi:hypothetical protein
MCLSSPGNNSIPLSAAGVVRFIRKSPFTWSACSKSFVAKGESPNHNQVQWHIFGVQAQRACKMVLRGIGIVRSGAKIGLRNLAYNLDRK